MLNYKLFLVNKSNNVMKICKLLFSITIFLLLTSNANSKILINDDVQEIYYITNFKEDESSKPNVNLMEGTWIIIENGDVFDGRYAEFHPTNAGYIGKETQINYINGDSHVISFYKNSPSLITKTVYGNDLLLFEKITEKDEIENFFTERIQIENPNFLNNINNLSLIYFEKNVPPNIFNINFFMNELDNKVDPERLYQNNPKYFDLMKRLQYDFICDTFIKRVVRAVVHDTTDALTDSEWDMSNSELLEQSDVQNNLKILKDTALQNQKTTDNANELIETIYYFFFKVTYDFYFTKEEFLQKLFYGENEKTIDQYFAKNIFSLNMKEVFNRVAFEQITISNADISLDQSTSGQDFIDSQLDNIFNYFYDFYEVIKQDIFSLYTLDKGLMDSLDPFTQMDPRDFVYAILQSFADSFGFSLFESIGQILIENIKSGLPILKKSYMTDFSKKETASKLKKMLYINGLIKYDNFILSQIRNNPIDLFKMENRRILI